jgi:histidyl-tRNA synthetase
MEYTAPKGVFDIVPFETSEEDKWKESYRWSYVESIFRQTANDYGYQEVRTPIFEKTELFIRGVGESSDIVSKEMYTFLDRAERSMTLRPEGTAPLMRALIENRLHQQPGLHKYFYIGPMFRYERQQAGRYRQHHQFGAEAIGVASPEQDVELIDMLCEGYRRLGLHHLKVMINSVGDTSSRTSYKSALSDFLKPHYEHLSADSKIRFSKNIMRILDSKDPQDQEILKGAPTLLNHLTPEAKHHFDQVIRLLDKLGIDCTVNAQLVRGLDYYNQTVFEITSEALGAQNSLGGGGRYDNLTASLGGPSLPSVGFATGIERILQAMMRQGAPFPSPSHPLILLVPLGEEGRDLALELVSKLRKQRIYAEIDLSGKKVQHGLQLANQLRVDFCLVIGDEELAKKAGKLKNMATRESFDVSFDDLSAQLSKLMRTRDV